MEPNYVAAKLSKNAENLSSAGFSSAQRRLMLLAGLGSALAAEPNLPAMDAFSLTSSVEGRRLTYTLTSKTVPTLGNCYLTELQFPNNAPVTWTSLPSGWTVVNNGSYSNLKCDRTNIIGNSVFTFTLETTTGGYSLSTNGAALGFSFFYGMNTIPWAGGCQLNCLIPDNSSTNLSPSSATAAFSWPCEAQFVGLTSTNVSIVANTAMQVQLQKSTNLTSWSNLGSPLALSNGVVSKIPHSAQDPQEFLRAQVLGPNP